IAVRYCDKTIRRSSSSQRGSLLPDKSIAPPVCQKVLQFFWASARVCAKLFTDPFDFGANVQTNSNSVGAPVSDPACWGVFAGLDRKSTRLNSSHLVISY